MRRFSILESNRYVVHLLYLIMRTSAQSFFEMNLIVALEFHWMEKLLKVLTKFSQVDFGVVMLAAAALTAPAPTSSHN